MTYSNRPPQGGSRQGGFRGESASPALPSIDLNSDAQQFIKNAIEWAECWTDERDKASVSQVRRFYGEIKRLDQLRKQMKATDFWQNHEIDIMLLKPKATYARVAAGKAPVALTEFIKKGVESIKKVEDFERFVLLFEAVLGFATPKLKNQN